MSHAPRLLAATEESTALAVVRAAFGREDEAALLQALRADKAILAELVVTVGGRPVGHLALSWMREPEGWACLAPVSVHPDHQGRGIGGALVRAASGFGATHPVVVLGDPEFYGRHGFDRDRARNLVSPYPVSSTLLAGGTGAPSCRLIYPAPFG